MVLQAVREMNKFPKNTLHANGTFLNCTSNEKLSKFVGKYLKIGGGQVREVKS